MISLIHVRTQYKDSHLQTRKKALTKDPALLAAWSQTSSLQNSEINVCGLNYPICGDFVIEAQMNQDKALLWHFTTMAFCISLIKAIHFIMVP